MQRVFQQDGLTLIEGDSREELPKQADESFDFILTDPPYGLAKKYGRSELGHRTCSGDEDIELSLWVWPEITRLLRPDRWAAVFCGWSTVGTVQDAVVAAGMNVKSIIAWDKTLPGLGKGIRNQYEMIVLARKGKPAEPFQGGNVWSIRREPGRPIHPNQKPVPLLQKLLLYYGGGGRVLDPFAGSGSSLVAAHGLGLEAVGIESEDHVWEAAMQRLSLVTSDHHILDRLGRQIDA